MMAHRLPTLIRVAMRCQACASHLVLELAVEYRDGERHVVGVTEASVASQELFVAAHRGPFVAA